MTQIQFGSRTLQAGTRPYLIAEIGVNHEGKLDLARKLIDLAKEGGADAAKFQSYKAGRIASRHSPAYWDTTKEATRSQFELFSKYDAFGPEEYQSLAEHCRNVGIDFASTPFDAGAVEYLDPLVVYHKIASADLTNVPLLRQIARKGKPVLLSTGASSLAEIDMAVNTLTAAGCRDLVLLQCTLNYPCPNSNAHLNMIEGLKRAYPQNVLGYSDHTLPDARMLILSAAWLKGALVLEKHFTHDKTLPGNDHYHAADVQDFKRFRENIALLQEVLGESHKHPLPDEAPAREHARRSIVIDRALRAGQVIAEADITYKRPAHGVSPLHWDEVIGRKAARDLGEDHVLRWEDLA
jgi:N-acetylneuraminate synthase